MASGERENDEGEGKRNVYGSCEHYNEKVFKKIFLCVLRNKLKFFNGFCGVSGVWVSKNWNFNRNFMHFYELMPSSVPPRINFFFYLFFTIGKSSF